MKTRTTLGRLACVLALAVTGWVGTAADRAASARTRVVIGVTETIASYNPTADSVAMMYGIWCQVYGCLISYDFEKGDYRGMLAERWEVTDPNTWVFHLRKDVKSHDGKPLTADDVIFSINRIRTDPRSAQKQNVKRIKQAVAVDAHTVKLITSQPDSTLLEYLTDRVMVMQKALFEKHGARSADREYPFGFGPYKLAKLDIGSQIVLEKNAAWPDVNRKNPDEVIYRIMREPEQRITALLNGEIQIAQFVPPHLAHRVEAAKGLHIARSNSIEMMFLAMSPKAKPWDNRKLRQAVAHAIDRETLIRVILKGQAAALNGPISKGQIGFDPKLGPRMDYDPAKARQLVKEAGYPDGVKVELYTPVGRYINDKQVMEAVVPMLKAVGIDATLRTPEWATLWANVRKGKVPFYYMGRGGMISAGPAVSQYFETGGSPRVGYSNPAFDALMKKARLTFDPAANRKIMNQAFSILLDEAPGAFLWQHKILYGVADGVHMTPRPDHRVFGFAVTVD